MYEELCGIFKNLGIPYQMGAFTEKADDVFIVFTPIADYGTLYADNVPEVEIQEVRIGLYVRNADWVPYRNRLKKALREADFTIIQMRYVEFERSTGYHHYNFDIAQFSNEEELI